MEILQETHSLRLQSMEVTACQTVRILLITPLNFRKQGLKIQIEALTPCFCISNEFVSTPQGDHSTVAFQ